MPTPFWEHDTLDLALYHGDAMAVLPSFPDGWFDAVVTDPPAGISFMGKEWDSFGARPPGRSGYKTRDGNAFLEDGRGLTVAASARNRAAFVAFLTPIMAECLRVCRPGAVALVWALPRTSHWTGTALEDAGWQIEDKLCHLFGCLSDDTEILTDKGWEPYQKVETGSLAVAYNVGDDTFGWEPIREVLTYDYCDTAYRIHSDRTDQLVSRNHRCLVERGGSYAFEYAEALQLEARIPVVEDVRGLLAALPVPRPLPGAAQENLLAGVFGRRYRGEELGEEEARSAVSVVRQAFQAEEQGCPVQGQDVRLCLSGQIEGVATRIRRPPEGDCPPWEDRLDGRIPGVLPAEDERAEQPGLEGRGDDLQDPRAVRRGEVRPLPGRPVADGPQGRLRDGTPLDRGAGSRAAADAGGGGSPRGPRPDEQLAGQSHALRLQPRPQVVRGARHATADLARVTPVFYRGVVWCVRVPSGAFVARRNGKVFVTGNSGFPKHKSKLKPGHEEWILCRKMGPKWLGVEECRIGYRDTADFETAKGGDSGSSRGGEFLSSKGSMRQSEKITSAGRWPANVVLQHSPGCVCRGTKRVRGSHLDQFIDRGESESNSIGKQTGSHCNGYAGPDGTEEVEDWACRPECPIRLLDEQSGVSADRPAKYARSGEGIDDPEGRLTYGKGWNGKACKTGYNTEGGASRFFATFPPDAGPSRMFYCAKAGRKDRNAGLENCPQVKIRPDLTAEQRAFVLAELQKAGVAL